MNFLVLSLAAFTFALPILLDVAEERCPVKVF